MKWAKFVMLVVFLLVAVVAIQQVGLGALTDHDAIQEKIDALGLWAPIVFIIAYALAITLTAPGTVVTLAGAAVFPLGIAFVCVVVGAMLGASMSFYIARWLGRDAILSVLGGEGRIATLLQRGNEMMETRGLMAVAYLRMAYVPFVALNYTAPLSGIRFRDFFWGTLLGIMPGTFVFVFLGNTLKYAWEAGDPAELLSWRGALAVALFGASLVLPWAITRFRQPESK